MKLKLKDEMKDTFMTCPFTGKMINLTFLEEDMYINFFYKGYDYLFEKVNEQSVEKKSKK